MNCQIHNKFAPLRETILNLPKCSACTITVLQDNRNIVTKVESAQGTFVVKDFRGMYFLNRLTYSTFRKSKAIRSYEHSVRLNSMGIRTPSPVAWIDEYSMGFLQRSIFISTYYPYKTLRQLTADNRYKSQPFRESLLEQLAAFALDLHQKGVYHEDFSLGNIFVIPKDDGYDFALTDLNRMRFLKSVSYHQALNNFRKIEFNSQDLRTFIASYARLCSQSPTKSIRIFNRLKSRSAKLREARLTLRRYTLGLFPSRRPKDQAIEPLTNLSQNKSPNLLLRNKYELQGQNQSTSKEDVPKSRSKHS